MNPSVEKVSFSVITPTIGRPSLRAMFESLLPQLSDGDEALVVGDGPQPKAAEIVLNVRSPFVRYTETASIRNYGNPQRNLAISKANGTHLFFVDDDDLVAPGAISAIKNVAQKFPDAPLMFKMPHPQVVIRHRPRFRLCGVAGPRVVLSDHDETGGPLGGVGHGAKAIWGRKAWWGPIRP